MYSPVPGIRFFAPLVAGIRWLLWTKTESSTHWMPLPEPPQEVNQ
ncbi:DUF551 domain-containing protein [Shigella flexneri 5a str. M90T]|nr:DUF551 domain-containing protein [Shigella flexneri]MCW3769405.1 DUF551 domain-containing protein [Shigella flexneri 5a str. M90T]